MQVLKKHWKSVLLIVSGVALILLFFVSQPSTPERTNTVRSTEKSVPSEPAPKTEQKKAGPVADAVLEKKIHSWVASRPGEYSVVVREATGGKRTASYQADKRFVAASTYKLFLIYAVLHQVEQGKVSLSANVTGGKNIPACLDSLLVYSSDECGWPMGRLIGWQTVNPQLQRKGFKGTDINNYDASGNFVGDKYSTATDEAEFVWRLHAGTLLNRTHTDMMLSRMKRQVWRERIPAGVPKGVVVAAKPGFIKSMYVENDTGIVYGKKSTYVVAIMSVRSSPRHLAELSKLIYDHLNS